MRRVLLGCVALAAAYGAERPAIVGVANIALKVRELESARGFYGHELGYAEAFTRPARAGEPELLCFKVNDHQFIEVAPVLKEDSEDRLIHIAFETTSAKQLRAYLASRGVATPPKLDRGPDGNLSFAVTDPDGHVVEFVEYVKGSLDTRNVGKSLAATRLSERIIHVGIHVADRAASDRFYKEILGFRPMWEGGPKDDQINWISLLVPDGSDWVEYMTNSPNPTSRQLGGMHHMALGVSDIQAAYNGMIERGYKASVKPILARDGRWLYNTYSPDLTRAEFMVRKPAGTPCCSPLHDPYIQ